MLYNDVSTSPRKNQLLFFFSFRTKQLLFVFYIPSIHLFYNCGSPALWHTGTPPPRSFLRGFCLVFSFLFSDNQSPKYDRPTKKYYIIKAQSERNTTPQNKKLFSKNATQPKQESNQKVRTNQHLSNKRRTKNENQFCCKDH